MAPTPAPPNQTLMLRLREALEASWTPETAYQGAERAGNRALGQCYPTARVVQHYFPATEILKGMVRNGAREDVHFWNGLRLGDAWYHVDLSWQQFPAGSVVSEVVMLDRNNLGDSQATIDRCALLLRLVEAYLLEHPG